MNEIIAAGRQRFDSNGSTDWRLAFALEEALGPWLRFGVGESGEFQPPPWDFSSPRDQLARSALTGLNRGGNSNREQRHQSFSGSA